MRNTTAGKLWYVVRTNIRCEDKAASNLRAAGYEVYLPKMRKDMIHHRTKAVITREFVLFNRYLFAAQPATGADWYTLRSSEGVECVLGVDGVPMPVPAASVEAFRNAEIDMQFDDTKAARLHRGEIERTHELELRKRFKARRSVRVLNGPFGGFAGQVESITGRLTIKAMILIFGRMTTVEFAPADLEPIDSKTRAA